MMRYIFQCVECSDILGCIFWRVENALVFHVICFHVWNVFCYFVLYFSMFEAGSGMLCCIFLHVELALVFCVIFFYVWNELWYFVLYFSACGTRSCILVFFLCEMSSGTLCYIFCVLNALCYFLLYFFCVWNAF